MPAYIHTRDDLQRLGAVAAFRAVQAAGFTPTLNLLWGLQGAIMDINWIDLEV